MKAESQELNRKQRKEVIALQPIGINPFEPDGVIRDSQLDEKVFENQEVQQPRPAGR